MALGRPDAGRGAGARFLAASQLVLALGRAGAEGRLDAYLRDVGRCGLLIVDEFGYVPIDAEGARLPCQVVADCHGRRSVIFTTNIEFSKWGTVLGDEKLAGAVVDRIARHGRLLEFGGASRRMEASLMLGRGEE